MKPEKILIIDDDPDVLLSARMLLEQLGFDVSMLSSSIDDEVRTAIIQGKSKNK